MIAQRPLAGFRTWRVTDDGRLWPQQWPATVKAESPYFAWSREPAMAECRYCDPSPGDDCQCGLYALAKILPDGGGLVHGAIIAWGRVMLCEKGFRAQYARPVALLAHDAYPGGYDPAATRKRHIRLAAERHGLPTLPRDELAAYAAWHGDPLVHPALAAGTTHRSVTSHA